MKPLVIFLLLTFLSFAAPVMAGSDHGHSHDPVDQVTAKINAAKNVASLVKRKKLDESWTSVEASSAEQKVFKGSPEWVVIFVNDKIADINKQKLYVFLSLGGEYIAANYTGN